MPSLPASSPSTEEYIETVMCDAVTATSRLACHIEEVTSEQGTSVFELLSMQGKSVEATYVPRVAPYSSRVLQK